MRKLILENDDITTDAWIDIRDTLLIKMKTNPVIVSPIIVTNAIAT